MQEYKITSKKTSNTFIWDITGKTGKTTGSIPSFPSSGYKISKSLFTNGYHIFSLGDKTSEMAMAVGLVSCASIVIACKESQKIAVYHANAGQINEKKMGKIVQALGIKHIKKYRVVYAIVNPWDNMYANDAKKLKNFKIDLNNITYIQKFPVPFFGADSKGYVGVPKSK